MTLAAHDLPSILAGFAFIAIVLLVQRVQSGRARAAAAAVLFLIVECVAWFLFPFTPLSYAGPPILVLVFGLFVELGAASDGRRRSASKPRDVRAVFQQRRTRCRRFSLLPMIAGMVIFLWGEVVRMVVLMYVNHVPLSEMPEREKLIGREGATGWVIVILVVPALLMIGGLVFGLLAYRMSCL